jgi:hypothetical protein
MSLRLADGGVWASVKVGLGVDGFKTGWGWCLAECEGRFGRGLV